MRDGQTLGTYPIEELSVRKVVELMVGGILTDDRPERTSPTATPALELAARVCQDGEVPRRRRHGPSGRDRRPLRACRLRASRRSRRPSTASTGPTRGEILLDGKADRAALAAGRAEPRHRAAAGEPQAAGHVLVPVDRVQHLRRAPAAAVQRFGIWVDRAASEPVARDMIKRLAGQDAQRAPADRRDVRRQRAEGGAGPAARRAAECWCSPSRPRASTSAPRRRSTGSSPNWPTTARRCWS